MFPVAQRSSLLGTRAQIYALPIEGIPIDYPFDRLIEEKGKNDTIAGKNLVLIAPAAKIRVDGTNLRIGAVTYVAGGAVRACPRGEEQYVPGPDGRLAPGFSRAPGILVWLVSLFPNTLHYGQ